VKPLILFIDDEISVLEAIRALVQPMGQEWETLFVSDSLEALDVVKTMSRGPSPDVGGAQEFAVVVSDLCMPGISGIEFFEVLHAVSPDTVRILLTGNLDAHLAIRSINDGKVNRYLSKSEIIGNLVPEVAEAIALHRRTKARRQEVQSARRVRELFLDTMTHEVRTPLNGIMGMLQLLKTTPLSAEQREYLTDAMAASTRLARLFTDILDYARLSSGQGGDSDVAFDPRAALDAVQAALAEKCRDKGLAFSCQTDAAVPSRAYGKEGILRQILFHLAENAVKFTEKGAVHVSASLLPYGGAGRLNLLFVVSDSGVGIPDERIETVFQPFTQVEAGYVRTQQGAGLGLAIVQRLVRLLRTACLTVESGEGGTSVYLSTQVSTGPRPEREGGGPLPRPGETAPSGTVLVIASAQEAVDALAQALRPRGVVMDAAPDANAGLRRLAGNDYRMIFVQMDLPDMDGYEVARTIRTSPGFGEKSRLPIVGLADAAPRREDAAGIDAFLSSPLEAEAVSEALRRHLGVRPPAS
jgi:signal transduction histidine kinase